MFQHLSEGCARTQIQNLWYYRHYNLYTHSIYGSVELKNENSQVNKIYEKGKNLKSTNKHEGHII